MRVWVDLANSPHVPLLRPIVATLEERGHDVLLTARDHAQTVELAGRWRADIRVVGGASPPGKAAKAAEVLRRAEDLRRLARLHQPHVAFSHGSYAQVLAARAAGVRAVTMMDYEHQPANHLSFRLARRVIVPEVFPSEALRRFGARPDAVTRYPGFKEEVYLSGFTPDSAALAELALDPGRIVAIFRPPPEGALYHPRANKRFDEILRAALARDDVQIVLLPRTPSQRERYAAASEKVRVPPRTVDGSSLLALADVMVGAGGTMNRESAILGTPTFTVFAAKLGAVDAELIRLGAMKDLRATSERTEVILTKKGAREAAVRFDHGRRISEIVIRDVISSGHDRR